MMKRKKWLNYDSAQSVFQKKLLGQLNCHCFLYSLDYEFDFVEPTFPDECSCKGEIDFLFKIPEDAPEITWVRRSEPEVTKETCSECESKGVIFTEKNWDCKECGGQGWVLDESEKDVLLCPICEGRKHLSSKESSTCGKCNGLGFHPHVIKTSFGVTSCPTCSGSGDLSDFFQLIPNKHDEDWNCGICIDSEFYEQYEEIIISKKDWHETRLRKYLSIDGSCGIVKRDYLDDPDEIFMEHYVFQGLRDYEYDKIQLKFSQATCKCVSGFFGVPGEERASAIRDEADPSCKLCSGSGFCFRMEYSVRCHDCLGVKLPCFNCDGFGYLYLKKHENSSP